MDDVRRELLNDTRELKHRRFWDAEGSQKLRVLFPGACYTSDVLFVVFSLK